MEAVDEGGEFVGKTTGQAKFANVEEGMENGAHHHGGADGIGGGFAVAFVSSADDLAHLETSASEGEGAEAGPVIPTPLFC